MHFRFRIFDSRIGGGHSRLDFLPRAEIDKTGCHRLHDGNDCLVRSHLGCEIRITFPAIGAETV